MSGDFFLTSSRLGFRAWSSSDLDLAERLWGDERVMALLGGAYFRERVAQRLAAEAESLIQDGVQYWPVFKLDDGSHVGCCGLRKWHFGPPQGGEEDEGLELGFHLRPEFWGQGIAFEAARSAVEFAQDRGERFVFAGHHPKNEGSKRVLVKLGFEPRHSVFYPPTGRMHPTYRKALTLP